MLLQTASNQKTKTGWWKLRPGLPICFVSLVPRLPRNANIYRGESLVSFLRKHDVIKIGPEQNGNILRVVQSTVSSKLSVYDIRPPIARYMC